MKPEKLPRPVMYFATVKASSSKSDLEKMIRNRAKMIRKCDYCGKEYEADSRNLKRGWGLCCSKSCAARKREQGKPGYSKERVERNNIRRGLWNAWFETDYCGKSPGDYDGADQDQWEDYFEHGV